ncbi:MAG: ASKHA domain-containing protein [Kiritimatiellae bacterium]|nr:ASKHA domain-containing protein [Kiritimatiellia bacterium]MDD5519632.1 ASKHA domain-containing protein [Kiritimatiellia bacterium]
MNRELRVTFEPSGRSVFVLNGTILLEAAGEAGYILQTPCGGSAKCGKCLVRITSGKCPPSDQEKAILDSNMLAQGYRLACQCKVHEELRVEIPDSSLFQTTQKILSHDVGGKVKLQPRTIKKFDRVTGVTTVTIDSRIIHAETGNTENRCYGVAFDVGTTTIVGTLVDLVSGADMAVASMVNPQTSYGDDVVSRIKKCRDEKDGLQQLQGAVIKAINYLTGKLLKEAGINHDNVYEVVFAGNTAMQEILCGINPESLGQIPFLAAFTDPLKKKASELGLNINPAGDVHVFPQIGGFVGGDTVAGIIATQLDRMQEPTLFVDVGTNGEIVLNNKGRLTATSVAAGPAFEGARIINGMRGTAGAIEKVVITDGDIQINVIGNTKPAGICGSGLIDIMAELLRCGVIDSTGRIQSPEDLPDTVPEPIRNRITEQNGQYSFLLANRKESATGKPIYMYQKDVRELQLANGAIRTGINILLKMENLKAADLGSVLLAGAFGNFIRRNNARRIGMLPPIPCERIRFMGNTASFGAKMVLLSMAEEEHAARITRATRHFDLSLDPEFQNEFSSAMLFPEGELQLDTER